MMMMMIIMLFQMQLSLKLKSTTIVSSDDDNNAISNAVKFEVEIDYYSVQFLLEGALYTTLEEFENGLFHSFPCTLRWGI